MAKSMRMGKFQPPQLRNGLTDFDEIRTIELPPKDHPQRKISFRFDDVSGFGKYPVCLCLVSFFVFLSFLVISSRTQVTPVDRFWRSIRHMTSFRPRMCLLGVSLILLPTYVVLQKNLGAWISIFMPNPRNRRTCILSKLLHRYQPNFAKW